MASCAQTHEHECMHEYVHAHVPDEEVHMDTLRLAQIHMHKAHGRTQ